MSGNFLLPNPQCPVKLALLFLFLLFLKLSSFPYGIFQVGGEEVEVTFKGMEEVSLCSFCYSAGEDVAFGSILELSLKTSREKSNNLK